MQQLLVLCAALCLGVAAAQGPAAGPAQVPNTAFSANNAPVVGPGGWREGRATFYDAPTYFQEAFASRGPGAFGSILYGDCQYYSREEGQTSVTYADQAYNKNMVAALASADPDYPGSCGRCYEIQCRDGLVIAEGTTPVQNSNGYNLQTIAPNTPDDFGRLFPGNPAKADNENFVQCWNNTGSSSILVKIIDTCPCTSATANNTQWCCPNADGSVVQHFDLSFWAFEQLAHPLYGTMMLNFRPVDCATGEPLTFLPGFINQSIYTEAVESGWSFNVYGADDNQFALPGAGVGGSNATCIQAAASGGVTFTARNGSEPGYQPFAQAASLTIWARKNGTSGSTGVPQNLKLSLQNTEQELYCGGNVILGQTVQPSSTQGAWNEFIIPISQFGCTSPSLSQVDALGIQNVGSVTEAFCLDNIAITGSSSSATTGRKLKF